MRNTLIIIIASLLFTPPLFAQKKQLTLNDVVTGGQNYHNLKPENLKQLQWANNDNVSYVEDDTAIIIQSIPGKVQEIFTISTLREIAPDFEGNSIPKFSWHEGKIIEFELESERLFFNIIEQKSQRIRFPKEAENVDLHYDAQRLAYTIDNNLYFATKANPQIEITNEQDTGIICGQSVHRNEFGITKGTFWSPSGNRLAFYRKDESMVDDYPLLDLTTGEPTINYIKYPMAGTVSEEVKVGIINILSGKVIYLKTDKPNDHYLTNITWSPDGSEVYVAEINREQSKMTLNCYSAATGQRTRRLFTETSTKYVEPQAPLYFIPGSPNKFLWLSRRDGYNHLYLYTSDGTMVKQITKGKWEITDIVGFDDRGKHIIVSTTKLSHLERNTYVVRIDKDMIWNVTPNKGFHSSILSPEGNFLLDTWSAVEIPTVIDIINIKNSRMKSISTADDPYRDYKLGKTELVTITAADSTTKLSGRIIYPPNFDKNKKYPAIIYVYGGPHSQMVTNSWKGGARKWQHYMAQKGYILFTLDNRGTSYRGAEFEQVIHRQLGKHEMADQMKGFDYLASREFIDKSRIGVFGWSYGGFMTTSLMTHYPEAFKVGVAGGPVIDWSKYEVMYGERYMDTPLENPEGYEATNLVNHAKNLQGRLLMIHGAQDPVVVIQHTQMFINECIKEGVQVDYFEYPTHEHNVKGKERIHLMEKITHYFDDNL